jgi:hypothetical protein
MHCKSLNGEIILYLYTCYDCMYNYINWYWHGCINILYNFDLYVTVKNLTIYRTCSLFILLFIYYYFSTAPFFWALVSYGLLIVYVVLLLVQSISLSKVFYNKTYMSCTVLVFPCKNVKFCCY